jgi:hypothetical protein
MAQANAMGAGGRIPPKLRITLYPMRLLTNEGLGRPFNADESRFPGAEK